MLRGFLIVGFVVIPTPQVAVANGRGAGDQKRLVRREGERLHFAEPALQTAVQLTAGQVDVLPKVHDAVQPAGRQATTIGRKGDRSNIAVVALEHVNLAGRQNQAIEAELSRGRHVDFGRSRRHHRCRLDFARLGRGLQAPLHFDQPIDDFLGRLEARVDVLFHQAIDDLHDFRRHATANLFDAGSDFPSDA